MGDFKSLASILDFNSGFVVQGSTAKAASRVRALSLRSTSSFLLVSYNTLSAWTWCIVVFTYGGADYEVNRCFALVVKHGAGSWQILNVVAFVMSCSFTHQVLLMHSENCIVLSVFTPRSLRSFARTCVVTSSVWQSHGLVRQQRWTSGTESHRVQLLALLRVASNIGSLPFQLRGTQSLCSPRRSKVSVNRVLRTLRVRGCLLPMTRMAVLHFEWTSFSTQMLTWSVTSRTRYKDW